MCQCVKISRSLSKSTKVLPINESTELNSYKWKEKCTSLEIEIETAKKSIQEQRNKFESSSKKIKQLQREIDACENIIKKDEKEKQELLQKIDVLETNLKEKDPCTGNVTKKLAKFEENITKKIAEMSAAIEGIQNTRFLEDNVGAKGSYADALKAPESSQVRKEILNETQYTRISDEHDKRRRSSNMIIHGKRETINDEVFVGNIFFHIGEPKPAFKVLRIGRREQGKVRPLKVIFRTELDKNKVMENLFKIKGREDYKGISITHDYSLLERKLIKEWVNRAQEMSSQNKNCTFKVWGNIKDGLYFKRFWKKKENTENQTTQV